jgi:hypothetical protein
VDTVGIQVKRRVKRIGARDIETLYQRNLSKERPKGRNVSFLELRISNHEKVSESWESAESKEGKMEEQAGLAYVW